MSVNQCYFDDYIWQLFPSIRLNLSGTINEKMELKQEIAYVCISNEKNNRKKITRKTFVICCLTVY